MEKLLELLTIIYREMLIRRKISLLVYNITETTDLAINISKFP